MLALLLLVQTAVSGAVVEGKGSPTAEIPRLEATEVRIDGVLDEPVWSQATRLTGFWQYQPVDGRPAEEETEVLVWYAPDAIYFGIIAHDRSPAAIRATVADRDNIDNDDHVVIDIDTFHDRRRAFFFGVNPLGAQSDGVRSEGAGPGQQPHPGQHRPQSRFHLGLEGPDHRPGLRGRDPDPVQEPPLPRRRAAELGLQRDPGGPAHRLHRHLDRRPAGQRQLPRAGRRDRRAARSQARGGGRGPAVRHRHRRRQPRRRRRRIRPRRRGSRRRAQLPAWLHQLRPRRHHQSRLQPGGERRGAGDGERAVRPLLSGEAAVLPRGHRAVRLAADAGLHPAHREPQGRRQAHRQVRAARRRPPDGGGRDRRRRRLVQHHPAPAGLRPQLDRRASPSPTATRASLHNRVLAGDFRYVWGLYYTQFQSAPRSPAMRRAAAPRRSGRRNTTAPAARGASTTC